MRIFVKTLTSDKYMIEIEPTTEIEAVKDFIQNTISAPANYQRLVFEGTELTNRATLAECKVQQDAILLVLPRRRFRYISLAFARLASTVQDLQKDIITQEKIEEQLDEYCFANGPINL